MSKSEPEPPLDLDLAREAKSLVALAFRNGPIEDVHAGKECPICAGKLEYSHITDAEMKEINKRAVDKLYALLWIKRYSPKKYPQVINAGSQYVVGWDLPDRNREEIESLARFADFFSTVVKGRPQNGNKSRKQSGSVGSILNR